MCVMARVCGAIARGCMCAHTQVRRDDAGAARDDLTAWERADLERKGISGPDVDAGAVM